MSQQDTIDFKGAAPDIYKALSRAEIAITRHGLDATLRHLVKLRASQMNGCAFCVKMHTAEARADGETNDRLDRLVVWRHVDDFSAAEKGALAWTEALTELRPDADYGALRARLRQHFSDSEIAGLTATVAMINLWNRLQVSNH